MTHYVYIPIACVYKSTCPLDPVAGIKGALVQKTSILCVCYITAFSRRFVDSDRVIEAIFDDDFGLSDKEDSDSNYENDDVYGYLGHSIISFAKIIDAAGDLVEEDPAFETEDETTVDASMLSLDNSTICDMFHDVSDDSEEPNEDITGADSEDNNGTAVGSKDNDGTAADNGEGMEVESVESTEQTVSDESLSNAESEVSGDETNYKSVIKYYKLLIKYYELMIILVKI